MIFLCSESKNGRLRIPFIAVLLTLAGYCQVYGADKNDTNDTRGQYRYDVVQQEVERRLPNAFIATAFSGGGLRAAMLSYGALTALRDTTIDPRDERGVQSLPLGGTTLLAEVDFVSAVSGGSVTASQWAVHGPENDFNGFVNTFINKGIMEPSVQTHFLANAIAPENVLRMALTDYSRVNLLSDYFSEKFLGNVTYEELLKRTLGHENRPYLVVNATDMGTQSPFPFVQLQFDLICDDLNKFRVSDAVAASAAHPLVFPALVRQNVRVAESEVAEKKCGQNASYDETIKKVDRHNGRVKKLQKELGVADGNVNKVEEDVVAAKLQLKMQKENLKKSIDYLERTQRVLGGAEKEFETLMERLNEELSEERRLEEEYSAALKYERGQRELLDDTKMRAEASMDVYRIRMDELQRIEGVQDADLYGIRKTTWDTKEKWYEGFVNAIKELPELISQLDKWFVSDADEDGVQGTDKGQITVAESSEGAEQLLSVALRDFSEWTASVSMFVPTEETITPTFDSDGKALNNKENESEDIRKVRELIDGKSTLVRDLKNVQNAQALNEEGDGNVRNILAFLEGDFGDYIHKISKSLELLDTEEQGKAAKDEGVEAAHYKATGATGSTGFASTPDDSIDDGEMDLARVANAIEFGTSVLNSAASRTRILVLASDHSVQVKTEGEIVERLENTRRKIAELQHTIDEEEERAKKEVEKLGGKFDGSRVIAQRAMRAKDNINAEVAILRNAVNKSNEERANRRNEVNYAKEVKRRNEQLQATREAELTTLMSELESARMGKNNATLSLERVKALYSEHERAVENYRMQRSHYEHVDNKFIHLMDGGAADNVGFTPLVELLQTFIVVKDDESNAGEAWRAKTEYVAVISVDARAETSGSPATFAIAPNIFGRIGVAVDAAIDGTSFWLSREIERVTERLIARGVVKKGFLVEVDFDQITHIHSEKNLSSCRRAYRKIPTNWNLEDKVVHSLIAMGRALVLNSGEYSELVFAFDGKLPPSFETVDEVCEKYEGTLSKTYKGRSDRDKLHMDGK